MSPKRDLLVHRFISPLDVEAVRQRANQYVQEFAAETDQSVEVSRTNNSIECVINNRFLSVRAELDWRVHREGSELRVMVEPVGSPIRGRVFTWLFGSFKDRFGAEGFAEELEAAFQLEPLPSPTLLLGSPTEAFEEAWIQPALAAPRAMDAPNVAEALARRRRLLWVLSSSAVVFTVLAVGTGMWNSSVSDRLEREGKRVTAKVVSVEDGGDSYTATYILGEGAKREIKVTIAYEPRKVGAKVEVVELPGENVRRVEGEDLDDPVFGGLTSEELLILFGLGAGSSCIAAVIAARRSWNDRRLLEEHRFQLVVVLGSRVNSNNTAAFAMLETAPPMVIRCGNLVAFSYPPRKWIGAPERIVLTVGEPETARLAMIASGKLVSVTRSRLPLRRRLWQRGLPSE